MKQDPLAGDSRGILAYFHTFSQSEDFLPDFPALLFTNAIDRDIAFSYTDV